MNTTSTPPPITDAVSSYIMCSLSTFFALLAIILSIMIIVIVARTKTHLHTIRHLLICNTCVASCFYCIVQTTNYICLVFLELLTDDFSCRWSGYFGYAAIAASVYSYLAQSISRLSIILYAAKYPWVKAFRTHKIIIALQWLISFILPLPALITNDIYFLHGHLCWVPFTRPIHLLYTLLAGYILPVVAIAVIYLYVFIRIKIITRRAENIRTNIRDKRDLGILRNIVISLGIYIGGGTPASIFVFTSIQIFYVIGIISFTFGVLVEKIFTIILDHELRQVIKEKVVFPSRNRVIPLNNTSTQSTRPTNRPIAGANQRQATF